MPDQQGVFPETRTAQYLTTSTPADIAATVVFVMFVVGVIASVLWLAPDRATEPTPPPLKWSEIPVCGLDCGKGVKI